ncbi:MAG: deoxyribonuclease IV [Candidatus Eisenbacteria bacterium]|nr:deoxyribonuclease IV [Candidatus Latescibacterota bacterium]MBD3302118.1 deoxyribonuclease IV [Candidatus Eisenbacteria bacterium]
MIPTQKADAPFVGAHMSIAGGVANAVYAAAKYRCRAVQLFSKSSNQWKAKPLTEEDVRLWREALGKHPMLPVVHDSYLINLGSPDPALNERSRRAFLEEVARCDLLEIPYLVLHPGSHMGQGEETGLRRIAESLDWVCARSEGSATMLLLETTAGQGTNLGYRFEHLARILELIRSPERFGVCVDTCHVLAAGYDFRTPEGYEEVFGRFDAILGIDSIRCFHVNDSKKDLGSRVDRHAHIGKGTIGTKPFGMLMRDPRFQETPKILETPKADDMDRKNLALLRRLAHPRAVRP